MKQFFQTKQFSKDIKRMLRRGKDAEKLQAIVGQLVNDEPLAAHHQDHPLKGTWRQSRDCHIEPDWVLIYTTTPTLLRLERTGSHSDLFE